MDKADFERLYLEMLPGLYRLSLGMLHNEADAHDAVQQAAAKAWQCRERIRLGGERAYFARIVINECRNIQRTRMRVCPVESLPETAYTPPDPCLKQAVDSLPEQLRLPLLLKYMEGYSVSEAAAALGISKAALKSRLLRARRKLKEALDEEVELI